MRTKTIAVLLVVAGLGTGCGGPGGEPAPTEPPQGLEYSANPAVYTKGAPIPENTPSSSGGAVSAYSVSPALPEGLSIDSRTGVISGAPTVIAPQATYLVTASNAVGTTTLALVVTVNDVAPANLTYSANPAAYTVGVPIAQNAPTSTGGAVVSYSVAPALPEGLALDPATGIVSGTPAAITAQATYTVTATNSGGSATADLELAVNDLPPSNLAYSLSNASYTKGKPITENTPTSSGGAVLAYSVSPALPEGLSLDAETGVISGTPTAMTPRAIYTVTASNSGGAAIAELTIVVNDTPPSNFRYSTSPAVYGVGFPIADNVPSNAGGTLVSYSVTPALPAGLSLHPTTGVISGTPTAITPDRAYKISAANSGGQAELDLHVAITAPPPRFAYVPNMDDGTLSIFAVNGVNGTLQSTGYVKTASYPNSVAVVPSGKLVYVASSSVGVLAYAIDPGTGNLSPVAGSPFAAGTSPSSLIVDPSGKFVYVSNYDSDDVSAFAIVEGTGALTPLAGSPYPAGSKPRSVGIDPSGKFLYVLNSLSSNLSAFSIAAGTGALTSVGTVATGAYPSGIAFDPAGKFAYVPCATTGVWAYTIDGSTGALTKVASSPYAAGSVPHSVAVHPSGKFVYVTDYVSHGVSAYSLNATTGELTSLGAAVATDQNPRGIAIDPMGRFAHVTSYGSDRISTYAINTSSGALTLLGKTIGRGGPGAIGYALGSIPTTYVPKLVYVANSKSDNVSALRVDPDTGALSAVAGAPFAAGADPRSVALAPSGKLAFVANFGANNVSVYSVDPSTGALTGMVGSPYAAGTGPQSVAIDPSGRFAYVANRGSNDVSAFSIDASTGALTAIGSPISSGAGPFFAAIDPSGRFLYVTNFDSDNVSAYSIHPGTGALTALSTVPTDDMPASITIDPFGRYAYVPNYYSSKISAYSVDPNTGALTGIGTYGSKVGPASVAIDPGGYFAYVVTQVTSVVQVYNILPNGALAERETLPTGGTPAMALVERSGRFLYVANMANSVSAYTANRLTGGLAPLGDSPFEVGSKPWCLTLLGSYR